jgi:aminotransferase
MKHPFSKQLEQIPPSGIRSFFELILETNDPEMISLGVGEPDDSTPWPIRQDAIESIEQGITSYSSNKGLLTLRTQIASSIKKNHHLSINPKTELLITTGVSEAIDLILRTIINPKDELLLPTPTYVSYAPLIHLLGGKVIEIDTSKTQFQLTAKQVQDAITPQTKAIILCSPNNPTGTSIMPKEFKKITALIQKHQFWAISDEIYLDLTYDKQHKVSLFDFPKIRDLSIILNGFSKSYAMTGWRIGYICGNEPIISRALKIHQYAALCAPITSQYAALSALTHHNTIIKEMKQSYLIRRNLCMKRFSEMKLPVPPPTGAFYCFPNISSTGLSDEQFAIQLLKSEKVAVVPGSIFGKGGQNHIRCCYATELNHLIEALNRIQRFITTVTKCPPTK